MDDFEYDQLVLQVDELVNKLESLPDSDVKQDIFELLKKLDLLHREGLQRLLNLIEIKAPRVIADVQKDFVIQTLLILYEFVQPSEQPVPVKNNGSFVSIDQIGSGSSPKNDHKMPIWIPVGKTSELKQGVIRSVRTEDVNLLFCKLNENVFALKNQCLDSVLPLDKGKLDGEILICPWHQCRYNVRTGEIQNGSGLKLESYPVRVSEDGKISVGLNV